MSFSGFALPLNPSASLTRGGGIGLIPNVDIASNRTSPTVHLTPFSFGESQQTNCFNTTLSVTLNPGKLLENTYALGYLLNNDGSLPFDLPKVKAFAEFYAVPKPLLRNCSTLGAAKAVLGNGIEPFKLGKADFEQAGDIYTASLHVPFNTFLELEGTLPDMMKGYNVIVNVTNEDPTSSAYYNDDVDGCISYMPLCNPLL